MTRVVVLGILIGFLKSGPAIAQSWQFLGLGDKEISGISIDPKDSRVLYVGTRCGGLFKSTDAGATWDSLLSGNINEIAVHLDSTDVVFVSAQFCGVTSRSTILKTTDGGRIWALSDLGMEEHLQVERVVTAIAIDPKRPNVLFAGTGGSFGGALWKSTNGGRSWFIPSEQMKSRNISAIAIDPERPDTVYVGTIGIGELLVSRDGGASWQSLLSNVGAIQEINIFPSDGNIIYASKYIRSGDDSTYLFKTVNGGSQWSKIPTPFLSGGIWSSVLSRTNSNKFYIGTVSNGVHRTNNSGATWAPLNEGLLDSARVVLSLRSDEKLMYAGTKGIYRYDFLTSVVSDRVPKSYFLHQNFPNPFNSTTLIRYSLAGRNHVNLAIYTLLGQKLMTLVDGLQGPGDHQARFDAMGFPSGTYFYRLRVGRYSKTRKLTLLR